MNKQIDTGRSSAREARPLLDVEGLRNVVNLRWQDLKTGFWEVLGCIVVAILIGLLIASKVTPSYRATVTLIVQPDSSRVSPVEDIQKIDGPVGQVVMTKQEILKSRALAGRVVDALDLSQNEYFRQEVKQSEAELPTRLQELTQPVKDWLGLDDKTSTDFSDPREYAIGKMVSEVVGVDSVPFTYAVYLHASTPYAQLSADIANALAREYIEYNSDQRVDKGGKASDWLGQRLVELKAQLAVSEERLKAFYEKEKLLNVGGERALIAEEYSDNSERLRDARRIRTELESIYKSIERAGGDVAALENINRIQNTNLVLASKQQYFALREEVSGLESRYGPKHPRLINAQARLKKAKENYDNQIRQTAAAIKSDYQVARNAESSLERTLGQSRNELAGLDRKQSSLESLKADVQLNRELFNSFQRRIRETDLSTNTKPSDTQIVDTAVPPVDRYSPSYKRWALGSALLGAFVGVLFVLLRLFLDDTVNTAEDLGSLTGYSVLGSLPHLKKIEKHADRVARVELDDPASAYAEAIRTLRTAIYLSDASKPQKRILVTSSIPSEGKTCLSVNLALAFGGMGRTLLLDCDFRNPSSTKYLNLNNNQDGGVVELLAGRATKAEAIRRFEAGNIDVLSCTQSPPNPSELIGSERFALMLNDLENDYDRIIIDSPPCQVVSDGLMLAKQVDATLFVAKAGSTPRRVISAALDRLEEAGAPILGAVLSQVNLKKSDDYGLQYYSAYYRGKDIV